MNMRQKKNLKTLDMERGDKMTHLLGNKRKFNGKYYTAMAVFKSKSKANSEAKLIRKIGVNARVVPGVYHGKKEYYLYLRK